MLMYTWDAITRGPVRRLGVHCDKPAALEAAGAALGAPDVTAVLVTQVYPPLSVVSGYVPTGNSWAGRRDGGRVSWTRASVNVSLDGLSRPAPDGHAVELMAGSAYRTGPGNASGTIANLRISTHYPVRGLCQVCLGVVCCHEIGSDWEHTGRQAGQDPAVAVPRAPATAGPAGDSSPGESPAGGEGRP